MPPVDRTAAPGLRSAATALRGARPTGVMIAGLAVCLLLAALPWLISSYMLFLATSAVISAIVARSVGLITSQAGMIYLCPLTFASVGGWVVSYLSLHATGIPFLATLAIGGLAAVPVGLIIGIPALRIRGVDLAVVTLGFAAAADLYINRRSFPGVTEGVGVDVGTFLVEPSNFYLLCLGLFGAISLALWFASRRPIGASWLAVRTSERATAALGVSVGRAKISAFAIGAFIAGLGGGLLAGQVSVLSPEAFTPLASLVTFAVAIVAGARFAEGALLAGALTVFVPEILRDVSLPQDVGTLFFALGAIDCLRRGNGGMAEGLRRALRQRRSRASAAAGLPAEATGWRWPADPARATFGAALEIRDLTVRFGEVTALDSVTLIVPNGKVTALVGPNGAGKSTLVDAVTGFLPGYEGTVLLGSTPLEGTDAHRRARLGVRRTFQQERTVGELTLGLYLRLASGRAARGDELEAAAAFFGLPPMGVPVDALDAGSRRIAEVCGAALARPAVLLIDEPAAGLADAESLELADRISELPERFGCSVLLIEHDMDHVRRAATEVTVLDFGKVIAAGEVSSVLEDPNVVAAYLGSPEVVA